jgi:intracellular multiplication protein IcmJ
MRFLPLIPSAHPSAWAVEPDETGWEEVANAVFDRDDHSCRFCGYRAVGWQEVFHLDGDHTNSSFANLATACVLCHSAQHLGRPMVTRELMLIWLPEMSQAALNTVTRRIHELLHAHGERTYLGEAPRSEDLRVHAALRVYRALAAEAATVERRIHTCNPAELGAALLAASTQERVRHDVLLGGIRLLHRGRYFHDGRDIYPQILSAWAKATPPAQAVAA